MKRVQVYSAFERFWHWLQALTIILLLLTGLEIHAPGSVRLLGFSRATWIHEALALFTIANAFLALFYHLVSSFRNPATSSRSPSRRSSTTHVASSPVPRIPSSTGRARS
jgi:cytochrome b subunit of formate dehydrogenase